MAFGRAALVGGFVLLAAACGGAADPSPSGVAADPGGTVTIPNHGGRMEGHTPTGFAGSGTGLFVGDNLNSSFPEGQGVQTFLTFQVDADLDIGSAVLVSKVLQTVGTPFDDLGDLLAERIEYQGFGPELFDLAASAEPVHCRVTDGTVACDVTNAVERAVEDGHGTVQFRLRFEEVADNDGDPDLALFYRSDSNTNEPGLFKLVVTP